MNRKSILWFIFLIMILPIAVKAHGASVMIHQPSGIYGADLKITMSTDLRNAKIYYTVDGSVPEPDHLGKGTYLYDHYIDISNILNKENDYAEFENITVPIAEREPSADDLLYHYRKPAYKIPKLISICAIAVSGTKHTEPVRGLYLLNDTADIFKNLSIISLTSSSKHLFHEKNGIYIYPNYKNHKEVPAHIQIFNPSTNNVETSQDIGLCISHETNPDYIIKSFELVFQNKKQILRNGAEDFAYTNIRNSVMHQLSEHLCVDARKTKPAVVFLNGEFWGVYHLQEALDDNYFLQHYNIPKEKLLVIETGNVGKHSDSSDWGQVIYGDNKDLKFYQEMIKFIYDKDLSKKENYSYFCDRFMDINSFMDYIIAQIFSSNNFGFEKSMIWKSKTKEEDQFLDGKFRFALNHFDTGMNNWSWSIHDTIGILLADNKEDVSFATLLFSRLIKNNEFKKEFVNRSMTYFSTIYAPETVNKTIEEMSNILKPGMYEHNKRWSVQKQEYDSTEFYDINLETLLEFAPARHKLLLSNEPGSYSQKFGLSLPVPVWIETNPNMGTVVQSAGEFKERRNKAYYFSDYPVTFSANPKEGFQFSHFLIDGKKVYTNEITVTPREGMVIKAEFIHTSAQSVEPVPLDIPKPFYFDDFSKRTVMEKENRFDIIDESGDTIYTVNKLPVGSYGEVQQIHIDPDKGLLLGNGQYYHGAELKAVEPANLVDYVVSTDITLENAGNEGSVKRPIFYIKLRSADTNGSQHYAIVYHMANSISNVYSYQWSIINTNAHNGAEMPLAKGYKLLEENRMYKLTAKIINTEDGGVNIKLYIDDPLHPASEYEPVVEYTDYSDYKITNNQANISFGTVGYGDAIWGVNPYVYYDNISIYSVDQYKKIEELKKELYGKHFSDISGHWAEATVKNLANQGIIKGDNSGLYKPDDSTTLAQVVKLLFNVKDVWFETPQPEWAVYYINEALKLGWITAEQANAPHHPITRYEMAGLLYNIHDGHKEADRRYHFAISDYHMIPEEYKDAVLYCILNGYMSGHQDLSFRGNELITKAECAKIIERIMIYSSRPENYQLSVPYIFSEHCVLQRDKKIPIWGTGFSGDTVTVHLKEQVKSTKVVNGKWYLELEPERYGGPYPLKIQGTVETITIHNVYIGEVFQVAGQSNSIWPYIRTDNYHATKDFFKDNSHIHVYDTHYINSVIPRYKTFGAWSEGGDRHAIDWAPAIGIYFLMDLYEHCPELREVPIGLMTLSYGGTTIEAFMSPSAAAKNGFVRQDDKSVWSGYYNGFIAPVAPYAIKAILYYQGEQSAHLRDAYEPLLRSHITGLREAFKDPNLPFFIVQLAGFGLNTADDDWPYIRAVQSRVAMSMDNVGIVSAVDLGDKDPYEIHPTLKQPIGQRLSALARKMLYHQDIPYMGPLYKNSWISGNQVHVSFDYVYSGLYFTDDVAKGFEICDSNGNWIPADAKITEDGIVIWNDAVANPAGARYAWKNYPEFSLYNKEGFPAFPFNTFVKVR